MCSFASKIWHKGHNVNTSEDKKILQRCHHPPSNTSLPNSQIFQATKISCCVLEIAIFAGHPSCSMQKVKHCLKSCKLIIRISMFCDNPFKKNQGSGSGSGSGSESFSIIVQPNYNQVVHYFPHQKTLVCPANGPDPADCYLQYFGFEFPSTWKNWKKNLQISIPISLRLSI